MLPKTKRYLTWAAVAAGILVVIVLIWLLFFNHKKAPDIVTQPVAYGDVEKSVLATGSLEPYQEVSVGAQVSGQVTKLAVELGQQVHEGDLIAEIDSAKQKNDLQTSQAQLNNIQAQKIADQANLVQAQSNFTRQQTLYAADAGSQADFDTAQAQLKNAQSAIDAVNAQIASATVAVNTAQVNLGYTRIVAPMDGTVISIVTKQGQTVNSNQSAPTIVVLGELDRMTVKAQISEADVINVKAGMPVYFTILGDPTRKFNATLRSIEPANTAYQPDTGTNTNTTAAAIYYNGLFDVDNTDGTLRPSMTANVSIVEQGAQHVLVIPSAALSRRGKGGSTVMVVAKPGAKPEARPVTTGINDGSNVQILSGLKEGELVVVAQRTASTASQGGPPGGGNPLTGGGGGRGLRGGGGGGRGG
ncbi:MAG: efflux RND transporter periplasmic adaptor subunit [Asticcacaulis sp.]